MLVIPTQALGFANLYRNTFRETLAGLLGAGSDLTPFPVKVLGVLFAAIVISMIISAFPAEAIKKRNKKYKMFIIGNGDVVQNRLYPALTKNEKNKENIYIFDMCEPEKSTDKCSCFLSEKEICDTIIKKIDPISTVFIETPTYAHFSYLEELIKGDAPLIVVEKPITDNLQSLAKIKDIIADGDNRDRLFFLSYYILEKALPLYYLTSHNKIYKKYLNIDDELSLHNWRLRLGVLKTVNIDIIEGADNRTWTFKEKYGGQVLETFIHNVLIASLFCGLPSSWEECRLNTEDENKVTLNTKSGNTEISLLVLKNAVPHLVRRKAELVFSGGKITADFDGKWAKIYFDDLGKEITISVKDCFADKYSVLVDLIEGVRDGCYSTREVDGLKNQIEVIEWLLSVG